MKTLVSCQRETMYLYSTVFSVTVLVVVLTVPGAQAASSVALSTCKVLMENDPLSFCCHTDNIPIGAMVTFYHKDSANVVATAQHPCDVILSEGGNLTCRVHQTAVIYNFTLLQPLESLDMGLWGCGFYGNQSTFVVDDLSVVTKDHGFQLINKGDNAQLTWIIDGSAATTGQLYLYNPSRAKILTAENGNISHVSNRTQFTGDLSAGNVSVLLKEVHPYDNGTYVLEYKQGKAREALTLVVLRQPKMPVITSNNQSIVLQSNVASGTIFCNTSSQSVAPLYYYADMEYTWLVPTRTYNSTWQGNQLNFSLLNCGQPYTLPVYCRAREGSLDSLDSQAFYPNSSCNYKPSQPLAPVFDNKKMSVFVGLLSFFITAFVFVTTISIVVGRRFICKKIRRCRRRHCCYRCRSSDSDYDSDSGSHIDLGSFPRASRSGGRTNASLSDGLVAPDAERLAIQEAIERSRLDIGNQEGNQNQADSSGGGDGPSDNVPSGGAVGNSPDQPSSSAPQSDDNQLLEEVERLLTEFNRSLRPEAFHLDVGRDSILDNMICHYTDFQLASSRVIVKVIGEDGMDCGGVMEDIYTTFWYRVQEHFFIGCEAVVPFLATHQLANEEKFRVIGRILSHSVALLKAVPIPMCKSAVIVMIFDTTNVARDTLLEDFLYFLDPHDRELVKTAMTDFKSLSQDQIQEMQTLFERFDYGAVVREDTFNEHLVNLARHSICIRPKPFLDLMRSGIPHQHLDIFWGRLHLEYLDVLYRALKPTATRIISRLSIHPDEVSVGTQKRKAFDYLQRLLHDLTDLELETFLQFTTGQKSTPRHPISVTFTNARGFQRTPKAHTCSNLLELPATYENYDQFRSEFKHLLAADESMVFSMA